MGDHVTPADIPLPAFLDPLLDQIRSAIPPPLYSVLLSFLSHTLALITAFAAIILSLLSTKPWEWDAQTVLPPLISLLAAYLALISLYRTTAWMIRTSLWFVKWGTIICVLIAGTGWLVGAAGGLETLGANGFMSSFTGILLDMMNGEGRNAAGSSHGKSQSRTRTKPRTGARPKPWESFERQREWQNQQQQEAGDTDVKKLISDLAGSAGRVMTKSAWWEAAKSMVDSVREQDGPDVKKEMRKGKTKATTGKTSPPR